MFTFTYRSIGSDTQTLFCPISNVVKQHHDYYRICVLRNFLLMNLGAVEFAKKCSYKEKMIDIY